MTAHLSVHPAPAGWAILATCDGETYRVETGLATPDRLEYWQQNVHLVERAIALSKGWNPDEQHECELANERGVR